MKRIIATLILTSTLLTFTFTLAAPPGILRTNVTLVWNHTNPPVLIGTNLFIDPGIFKVYSTTNPAIALTNWPLFSIVAGTNNTTTFTMQPQMRFYAMTFSNFWGESTFSGVVWTPPMPLDLISVGIE